MAREGRLPAEEQGDFTGHSPADQERLLPAPTLGIGVDTLPAQVGRRRIQYQCGNAATSTAVAVGGWIVWLSTRVSDPDDAGCTQLGSALPNRGLAHLDWLNDHIIACTAGEL